MTDIDDDVSTVEVTIDGRPITARKGELVIAAAERNDTYIPRFCWHNRMNPVGMCRMCLVEIDSGRGPALQPSCMIECTDGMEVSTATDAVIKAQEGVLEFLLINHPLDCPVCDKGGECPLQDQTMSHGPGESRYVEEKRHKEKPINVSDLVLLDRERCILCDRCTRFAKEVAGDPLIHFLERGNETEVNTFPDHEFASYFSGNTVQICPVGALTSTPYRFKARPWDLVQTESTCMGCAVGCRIVIDTSRDELLRFDGVDSEPVNWSWLCDKGRFGFEAFERGDRLTDPLVRADADAQHRVVRWNDALDTVATAISGALDDAGPSSVAVLGGAHLTNEAQFAWAKLAKGVVGTDNVDAQLGDGLDPRLVLGLPRATIDQTCAPGGTILVYANDVKEDLGVLFLRLRHAAVWEGAKIVEVGATATGLTPIAAASVRTRPGEGPAVIEALLAGGEAPDGVDADAFARAAELLGDGDRGPLRVVLGRPSLAESAEVATAAAHRILAARPDATFLTTLRRGNVYGALDMGLAPGLLPGRVTLADGRTDVAAGWGIAANELPRDDGLDARGILEAAAAGKIATLILLGADPIADFGDTDLARRALDVVDTVVAVDLFVTESVRHADVILPASGFGATDGTTTNLEGRVTEVRQAVTAPGTAHDDWVIAAELAFALDADLGFDSLDGIRTEIARTARSHAALTDKVLHADPDGTVFPVPADDAALESGGDDRAALEAGDTGEDAAQTEAAVEETAEATGEPPTADPESALGEVVDPDAADPGTDDGPNPAAEAPATGTTDHVEVPAMDLPAEPDLALPPPDAYAYRLVVTRKMYDQATITQQAPHLAALATPPADVPARLNPADVAQLGIGDGAAVRIHTARAQITLPVQADAGVPRGIVAIASGTAAGAGIDLVEWSQTVTDVRVETVA